MPSDQFNIRMATALKEALEAEAAREGMPASEFVRQAIAFRLGYIAAVEHGVETHQIEAMLRRILERGAEG